eukprot:3754971-Heterocapsa_arctica.AAC.1
MVWNAMVVRTVNKKELSETPGAKFAMDTEYDKLERKGVWDLITVRGEIRGDGRSVSPRSQMPFWNGVRHLRRKGQRA